MNSQMILITLLLASHTKSKDILTQIEQDVNKELTKKKNIIMQKELMHMKVKQKQSLENWYVFNQQVSHFESGLTPTFPQRYYKKARNGTSPFAVLYIGGEGPLNFVEYDSVKVRLADDLNATLYAIEHRGYGIGDKIPLKFITADEAVEDLANFAATVDPSKKWIIIGGSYSGTLVHYAMLKYPHLFHTGWSSSAPLYAKENFYEYDQIVSKSLPTGCSEKIRLATLEMDKVQESNSTKFTEWKLSLFPSFGASMTDVDFLSYLSYAVSGEVQYNNYGSVALKYLCSDLEVDNESAEDSGSQDSGDTDESNSDEGDSDEDDSDFEDYGSEESTDYEEDSDFEDYGSEESTDYEDDSDSEGYGSEESTDYKNDEVEFVKTRKNKVKKKNSLRSHKIIKRRIKTTFDVDKFIARYIKFVNMTMSSDDAEDNSMSVWTYQCCTDFGWWQVAPKENSLRSKLMSVEWSRKEYCQYPNLLVKKELPQELPRTTKMNNRYAYLKKLPRVLYTNGENDPWSALGHSVGSVDQLVQYDNNKCGSYGYMISQGSHCNDFYPILKSDTENKRIAKMKVLDTLRMLATSCQ
eukprot:NODE_833_length_3838_cov_0.677989.p1 type:complete len:581 gc:universal NODE_833_length_3838_cov_0.677989:1989-247(-)